MNENDSRSFVVIPVLMVMMVTDGVAVQMAV